MRHYATATVAALSFFTTPTLAETLFCPPVQQLPVTMNLQEAAPAQPQLRALQAYLTNLQIITARYNNTNARVQRNSFTNCLMDHLVMLPDYHALQRPATPADVATWFLIRDEVITALNTTAPFLTYKPQMPFIEAWLDNPPIPRIPQTLASR